MSFAGHWFRQRAGGLLLLLLMVIRSANVSSLPEQMLTADIRNPLSPEKSAIDHTLDRPLYESALALNLTDVEILLAAGAHPDGHKDAVGNTALMWTSHEGNTSIMEVLLKGGANVNHQNNFGFTPLMAHAFPLSYPGQPSRKYNATMEELIGVLLAAGADKSIKNRRDNETALGLAKAFANTAFIQVLEPTFDVSSMELFDAAQSGKLEEVDRWLKAGEDPDAFKNKFGCTALMASLTYPPVVRLLLQSGANPNHRDMYDHDALMLASLYGYNDSVAELLEAGADVLASTRKESDTALTHACDHGHAAVAKVLLEAGADLNHKAKRHNDHVESLHIASVNGFPAVVEVLLEEGAKRGNLQHRKERREALAYASKLAFNFDRPNGDARGRYFAVLDLLTNHRGSSEVPEEGPRRLYEAVTDISSLYPVIETEDEAAFGHLAEVQELLQLGVHPDAYVGEKGTALIAASSEWTADIDIMKALIAAGANVNYQTDDGTTALIAACKVEYFRKNSMEPIDVLLTSGADKKLRDKRGLSALDYAKERKWGLSKEFTIEMLNTTEGWLERLLGW